MAVSPGDTTRPSGGNGALMQMFRFPAGRMAGAGGQESSGPAPPGPVIYSVHSAAHIPQEIARGIGVPLQYLGFNHPLLSHHTPHDVAPQFPPSGVHQPFLPHRRFDPRSQNTQTRHSVTSPPVSRVVMPAWQHNKPMPLAGIHPYQWTKAEVLTWVRWAVDEFSLTGVDEQRFGMNGKALSLLGKEGFTDRVPFAGDVLYNLLHNLLQGYEHLARNNIPISPPHATPMCYPTPPPTNPSPKISVSSPGSNITALSDPGDHVPALPAVSQTTETKDRPEVGQHVTPCSPTGMAETVRVASAELHRLKEQHQQLVPSLLSVPELQVQGAPVATATSPTMPELTKIDECPSDVTTASSHTRTTESSHEAAVQTTIVAPVVANSARSEEEQNKLPTQQPALVQGRQRDPLSRHPKRRWSVDAVAMETADPTNHDPRAAKVVRVGPNVEGVQVQGQMTSPPSFAQERPEKIGENVFIPSPEIERELAKLRERDARRMKLYDKSISEEALRAERRYMPYAEPGRVGQHLEQVQFYHQLQGDASVRPPANVGQVVGEAAVLQQPRGPQQLTSQVQQAFAAQQTLAPTGTPVPPAHRPVTRSSTRGETQQLESTTEQPNEMPDAQATAREETANGDELKSQQTPDTSEAHGPNQALPPDGNIPPVAPRGHTALGPHLIRGEMPLIPNIVLEQLRGRRPPFLPNMRLPFPAQILGPDGKPLQELVARHRLPVPVFPQYTRQETMRMITERGRRPEQVPTGGDQPRGDRQTHIPPTSVDQPPRPAFPPKSTGEQAVRMLPVPPIYRLAVPTATSSGSSVEQQHMYDLRGRTQAGPISGRTEETPTATPHVTSVSHVSDVRVKVEKTDSMEEGYGVAPGNGQDHHANQQSLPVIKAEAREERSADDTGQTQVSEADTGNAVEPAVEQAVNSEEKPTGTEEKSTDTHILRQMLTRPKGYCKEFWYRVHDTPSPTTTLPTPTTETKPFQSVTTQTPQVTAMTYPDPRGPPPPPVKRGRGRPRIYWPGYRKKPPPHTNTPPGAPVRECRLLWEFLLRLLAEEEKYKFAIRWLDKPRKVFRIVNANAIARLWGMQKNREGMTYEKLSRAMRYYYRMEILVKEGSQRLTYRFLKGLEDIHADRANRRRGRSASTSSTTSRDPPTLPQPPHGRTDIPESTGNAEVKPEHTNLSNMQGKTQRLYGTNGDHVSPHKSMQLKAEEGSNRQTPTYRTVATSLPTTPGYKHLLDFRMYRRSHSVPQEAATVTSVSKTETDTTQVRIPYRSEETESSNGESRRKFLTTADARYVGLKRKLHTQTSSSVVPHRDLHKTTDDVPKAVSTAPPIFKKRRFSMDSLTSYSTVSLDTARKTKEASEKETVSSEPHPYSVQQAMSTDTHQAQLRVRITDATLQKQAKTHDVFPPPSVQVAEGGDSERREKEDTDEQEEPLDMSVRKT